jgi:RES domain-containing protein
MLLWRISNYEDLNGLGGLKSAGRWHTAGQPVVYLSEHPALTLLELLAQFRIDELPAGFKLLQVHTPKTDITRPKLPDFWRNDLSFTRETGDAWLQSNKAALLQVPTVLVPFGWNYILNPNHPTAQKFKIRSVESFQVDPRLR